MGLHEDVDQIKILIKMMTSMNGDLQNRILMLEEEVEVLKENKEVPLCQKCGKNPVRRGHKAPYCKECYRGTLIPLKRRA